MDIVVKFADFKNTDVIATSGLCTHNSGTIIYKGTVSGYYLFGYGTNGNEESQIGSFSSIWNVNGNEISSFSIGSKYHYDSSTRKFYLCDSDHALSSTNPFDN